MAFVNRGAFVEGAIHRQSVKARKLARRANKAETAAERAALQQEAEDLRILIEAVDNTPDPSQDEAKRLREALEPFARLALLFTADDLQSSRVLLSIKRPWNGKEPMTHFVQIRTSDIARAAALTHPDKQGRA